MAGEGARLKEAREALGLTLADIEETTKIRTYYLNAIENEAYEILPGDTYVRGFLRNYARCLNLDGNEIVAMYAETNQPEELPLPEPTTEIMSTPIWFRPLIIAVMAIFVIATAVGVAYLSRARGDHQNAQYETKLPVSPEIEPVSSTPENNEQDSEGEGGEPGNPDEPVSPSGELTLELTFTERCWLVVKADEETVISGMLQRGEVKKLTATKQFELVTVGNAGGVSMVFNGKALPPLGRSGEVVSNHILAPES